MTESIVSEKFCCGCRIVRLSDDFHKWNRSADGLAHYCKICKKAKWKPKVYPISVESALCVKCNQTKPALEMVRKENKRSGIGNACLECLSKHSSERYKANPDPAKERARAWEAANKAKVKAKNAAKYKENPDALRVYFTEWKENNRGKYLEALKRKNAKLRQSPNRRIRDRISQGIRFSIRTGKGGRSWEKLVGYTLDDLVKRLKSTLPPGYEWNEHSLKGLDIDHIIPVSAFNFQSTDDIDFKRCWGLKNLRLLPKTENIRKGGKIDKPFQPSLTGI
jgi:hypothetical protein